MVTQTSNLLQKAYPWTSSPLIISGPLRPYAMAPLATSVSLSGGFGFLSYIPNQTAADLQSAQQLLEPIRAKALNGLLPVGIGFLIHSAPIDTARELILQYWPAAVWLFAPSEYPGGTLAAWAAMVRESSPSTAVWVQVGSVAGALEAVTACAPSPLTLVVQGADAGGHGLAAGAGITTLVPEVRDALAAAGHGNTIPVIAAGGIVEARGAAAALTLGADAVVVGTRFLCAAEASVPAGFQEAILRASDGGQSTFRTVIYDMLRGTKLGGEGGWPLTYNGRGLKNVSSQEYGDQVPWKDIKQRFNEAQKEGKPERFGVQGRDVTYAGTGVGLIGKVQPAREIVEELRNGALEILQGTASRVLAMYKS